MNSSLPEDKAVSHYNISAQGRYESLKCSGKGRREFRKIAIIKCALMAPIPEDNQDKPSDKNNDESELGPFSNPNMIMPVGGSDSSDDNEDDNSTTGVPHGYSLLPQDPGEDDDDDEGDNSDTENTDNAHHGHHVPSSTSGDSLGVGSEGIPGDTLPETVLSSEAGAAAPSVLASTESCHPAFLAKFPDGKIPSYMQVPSMPRDMDGHLWNQRRQETNKLHLDAAQESKILRAMSGFSLPTENIPDWAKNLPDDQWQQQVLVRIGTSSGRGKHPSHSAAEQSTESQKSGGNTASKESSSSSDNNWVADFPDADTSQQ